MDALDEVLEKLAGLVVARRFEEMETDGIEIKPVPTQGNEWRSVHKSVDAFLNTHRRVRYAFNRLLGFGYLKREAPDGTNGYALNEAYAPRPSEES